MTSQGEQPAADLQLVHAQVAALLAEVESELGAESDPRVLALAAQGGNVDSEANRRARASTRARIKARFPSASPWPGDRSQAAVLEEPPEAPISRAVDDHALPTRGRLGWQRKLVRSVFASDLVAGALASTVALVARPGAVTPRAYIIASLLFPLVWVFTCASTRSYEFRFLGTGSEEFRRVFDAGLRLLLLVSVGAFAFRSFDVSRVYVLFVLPLVVALSLLLRYLARQVLHRLRATGRATHRVLVVGSERSSAELVRQLHRETYAGFAVVGICADRPRSASIEGVPVVGTSSSIIEALARTDADTVVVGGAWSNFEQSDLRRLSWQLEGSSVSLVVAPSLADLAGPRIHIRPVAGLPLLHVEQPEFSGGRRLLKNTFDRLSALLLLLLLSPALLCIAACVGMTSRGGVFFRQTRVGVDGRTFTMYKFRSMYRDAEQRLAHLHELNQNADGLLFRIRDDPRVTSVGKWLRQFSLDEVPQLFNVVKGDMSIVGPRPPLPREVAQYGEDVRRRLLVRPGLTGLWQISGRSDLSWEESVRLDLHYVENWSLALDLMIIWKTVFAVLSRRGAY